MPKGSLIGVGCGLVSALLIASAGTGSILAIPLFFLAALPGFIAGLGWGSTAAFICALTGAIVVGVALNPALGLIHFVAIGLPVAVLCYLALLARPAGPAPAQAGAEAAAGGSAPGLEWYPPGNLVATAAIYAGLVTSVGVLMIGTDYNSYATSIRGFLDTQITDNPLLSKQVEALKPEELSLILDRLVLVFPPASALNWLMMVLANFLIAGKIVEMSGRAIRPWPPMTTLTYPSSFSIAFLLALGATLVQGMVGLLGSAFLAAFFFAFLVLGLTVVHVIARGAPGSTFLLVLVYIGIFVFGWVALIIAAIGVGEPVAKLRERFGSRRPPNQPGSSPV